MNDPHLFITKILLSGGQTIELSNNDKILIVGPNNSGKSQLLRDVIAISVDNSGRKPSPRTVVKDIKYQQIGSKDDLKRMYTSNSKVNSSGYFVYKGTTVGENYFDNWGKDVGVSLFANAFIKNIPADLRLNITQPQKSISPGEPKSVPQHYLYDSDLLMSQISKLFHDAFGSELFFDYKGGSILPIHVGEKPQVLEGEDRLSDSYVAKVRRTPQLHLQGDGVKSYAGILFEAVAERRDVTLIDEPEAFLHPPQMKRLGETLASEVSGQVIVATHSSDILRGFLSGPRTSVRIVRIQRVGDKNFIKEASSETMRALWEQPDLRFSNALDGIFHEQVIICEDDSDCRLFSAVAEHLETVRKTRWGDTAYIPAGGKHAIHKLAKALREMGVPVTGVFDIDLLADSALLKATVESFGGDWERIGKLWTRINAAVLKGVKPKTPAEIKAEINRVLGRAEPDELPKREISNLLKQDKAWAEIKRYGVAALPSGQTREEYNELEHELYSIGIAIVSQGEVEKFCPSIGGHGPKFVTELLQIKDLAAEELSDLRLFVERIHCAHRNIVSPPVEHMADT